MNKEFALCSALDSYVFDGTNNEFVKVGISIPVQIKGPEETKIDFQNLKLLEIAEEINLRASGYRMGRFQSLRKELKKLSRVTTSRIFTRLTIADVWAFHHGGRKELQFNVGFEHINKELFFRHGVAFSLEPSQSLPDIEVLLPKIEHFNDYIRETYSEFRDMQMWHWYEGNRSENYAIREILPKFTRVGYFIFLGKLTNPAKVNVDEILQDFDRLLNLYEYVEGEGKTIRTIAPELDFGFQFHSGCSLKKSVTTGSREERRLDIILRHNDIQSDLYEYLRFIHGDDNVGTEIPVGCGKKIDVVVKDPNSFTFYEIKTSSCLQVCIREALSQLLEYSFWPDTERAKKLVIVTENETTEEARKYLTKLRDHFGLPVYHQRFDSQSKVLEDIEI